MSSLVASSIGKTVENTPKNTRKNTDLMQHLGSELENQKASEIRISVEQHSTMNRFLYPASTYASSTFGTDARTLSDESIN